MSSRSFAAALIFVTGTAAAGGSYLALRQNAAEAAPLAPRHEASPTPVPVPAPAETRPTGADEVERVPAPAPVAPRVDPAPARRPAPRRPSPARVEAVPVTHRVAVEPAAVEPPPSSAPATPVPPATVEDPASASRPAETVTPEPDPVYYEIVVPSSAVIGLEIENTISSEQARVEDRVDARITRDVFAEGRLAIPAGSRVIGAVTVVERGGKLKDRARLGVRFHTLVLAGGRQVPLRTEEVYREGASPGAESTKKIGGGAVGGAVLGAILGGGKGAITGASIGAGAGTAAVMAGGRNAATLNSGSVVTVRLSAPVTLEVER